MGKRELVVDFNRGFIWANLECDEKCWLGRMERTVIDCWKEGNRCRMAATYNKAGVR
ncbi:hypothetical protein [Desulfogranum marinum]|uniref:hypothetical protein n=1 Tax=Desulfogranum marinum TaxID=453220 RepID=UPI0019668626|nr:hypothetical protein [Desulfogranum marinum]MBM9514840.1 hypothetical protein [Desulfogranum marinum]